MSIKAVVVDVDGTLTDMNKVMFTSGIEALRKVQTRGVPVSLASGNVLPVAYGLSTYMGLQGPIVAENGGVVSYREQIFQVSEGVLPEKAYEYLRSRMPVERLFTDNWRRTEVALRRSADLDRVREELKDWNVTIEATGFAIHIMDKKTISDAASRFVKDRAACVLGTVGERFMLIVACNPSIKIDCVKVLNTALAKAGGRGGGKPSFATGGAPGSGGSEEVMVAAIAALTDLLTSSDI